MRIGLLLSNVIILAIILAFVLQNPHTNGLATPALLSNTPTATNNPLDQVSSADIAQTVARLNGLPETTAINNQAQSQAANIAIASSNDNVVSKPQVVATALKSRADIQAYTSVGDDTLSSLANKFGVTSSSIALSNGLATAATISPGLKLVIPPVNGIVYTVRVGDTPTSLAQKFSVSQDQIVAYNDAEINGLQVGEQIIIPNATQPISVAAAGVGNSNSSGSGSGSSFPWGSGPMYGFNGYDYGYCTWYVATQVNVPGNWGNASTWAIYARLSGWNVSQTPTVGSVAQTGNAAGGEGHVAIVTGVNPDGTIQIRDMNGIAGWGRVGNGTTSAGTFQNYISQ